MLSTALKRKSCLSGWTQGRCFSLLGDMCGQGGASCGLFMPHGGKVGALANGHGEDVGPGRRCGWVRKGPGAVPRTQPFLKTRAVLPSSTIFFKVRKARWRGEGRVIGYIFSQVGYATQGSEPSQAAVHIRSGRVTIVLIF